ncbi:MAG TPA: hypothetical protein VMT17_19335 [Anaeromyxobacteraceae bacterium]|nr:hypothetical protein [Anaeromyxobacteraceae bacterium]
MHKRIAEVWLHRTDLLTFAFGICTASPAQPTGCASLACPTPQEAEKPFLGQDHHEHMGQRRGRLPE